MATTHEEQSKGFQLDSALHHVKQLGLPLRTLPAAMIGLYLLGFIPSVYMLLAVTPGEVPPPLVHIWTLLTGAYIESSLVFLVFNVAVFLATCHYLEPVWGALKIMEYIVLTNFASITCTAISYIGLYAFTGDLDMLFWQFSGFIGASIGCFVALKQAYPQGGLPLVARLKIEIKAFAFEDFFPSVLQPIIKVLGTRVYTTLALMQLCPTRSRTFDLSQPTGFQIALPDVKGGDAARRQQLALRHLDERLHTVVVDQSRHVQPKQEPKPDNQAAHSDAGSPS